MKENQLIFKMQSCFEDQPKVFVRYKEFVSPIFPHFDLYYSSYLSTLHNSLESTKEVRQTLCRSILIYIFLPFYLTLQNSSESTKQVHEAHCRSILIYTILAFYLTLHNTLESMKQVHETYCRSILIYTILPPQIFGINETSM